MRIVLFTVEDADFMPLLLEPLLRQRGSQIVAAFVSRSIYGFRFVRRHAAFAIRNGYPFCIRSGDWRRFLGQRTRRAAGRNGGHRSTLAYLRSMGIAARYIREIRTEGARSGLRALDADVFLFCPFDKIAGPKFLAIPQIGTFNLHLGKLPEYRGGLHSFWVLRFGDAQAGATVHRVIPELDAGEIVTEHRFPVRTKSVHELMRETMHVAGSLTLSALNRIESGDWRPVDISHRPIGYHMMPGRRDFQAFYGRGCRLI